MKLSHLALLAAAAAALSGCAASPKTPATDATPSLTATALPASECTRLQALIAETQATRQAAEQKAQDAWKAVVPFAVAARHVSGRSAATEAEQRLAGLQAEFDRKGCLHHGE